MECFIRILEILAWPVTVLVLAVLFRSELVKLLARLSSVKYKDFEAQFERELRQAERDVAHLRTARIDAKPTPLEPTVYDQLLRIAEVSPRAAVSEAWRLVENAAVAAARVAQIEVPQRGSPVSAAVGSFVREEVFSEDAVALFDRLRRLRNDAVHAPDFALDAIDVERYVDLALRLEQDLFHAGNAVALAKGILRADQLGG